MSIYQDISRAIGEELERLVPRSRLRLLLREDTMQQIMDDERGMLIPLSKTEKAEYRCPQINGVDVLVVPPAWYEAVDYDGECGPGGWSLERIDPWRDKGVKEAQRVLNEELPPPRQLWGLL